MAKLHTQTCPVASFLNLFGDAWTWLVMREAFYGATRFSEFRKNTGIARNLLSERLSKLVDEGLLERKDVGERGPRYAYFLTEKGKSLVPVLVSMVQWSNAHLHATGMEPVLFVDAENRQPLADMKPLSQSGQALHWGDILAKIGPGASRAAAARVAESQFFASE
jgi:DNA-binding HxlR family transcriptional regulator